MKKIFIFFFVLFVISVLQAQQNYFGEYTHLEEDTLKADSTWYSIWLNTAKYPYLGIMVRTFNPADSTKYNVTYVVAYDTTSSDTFFVPCSENGSANNAVFLISDSSSTYMTCTVQAPVSHFVKIKIVTDDTDHGNRCGFWLKTFLWKPLD